MSIILKSGSSGNLADVTANKALVVEEYDPETFYGCYNYHSGNLTVQATAHAVNTGGFFWIVNKLGSGKKIRLERVRVATQITSALSVSTVPRLAISLMTFTGTPSGTPGTAAKFDSNYPAQAFDIRTTIAGLTCTYGQVLWAALPVTSLGSAGLATATPSEAFWIPREDNYEVVIHEGEGVVFWQPDAGSNSDTRKVVSEIMWEEYNG